MPVDYANFVASNQAAVLRAMRNATGINYYDPFSATATAATVAPPVRAFIDGKSTIFLRPDEKFTSLAEIWEQRNILQGKRNFNDLAFLQIIGMGEPAIPPLLERIRNRDTKWIYALKCISGQEAETKQMQGDVDQIIGAWIAWGIQYGYIK